MVRHLVALVLAALLLQSLGAEARGGNPEPSANKLVGIVAAVDLFLPRTGYALVSAHS
jgi:hypothetical protein